MNKKEPIFGSKYHLVLGEKGAGHVSQQQEREGVSYMLHTGGNILSVC